MHANEPDMDRALVGRLVAAQLPEWAGLDVTPVDSVGTTNWIFRLGDAMTVRLPRVAYGEDAIDRERRWLPHLAPELPLEIPRQLAIGAPGEGYPFRWSVHTWLRGEVVTEEALGDLSRAAVDLAAWIRALQSIDAHGGPDAARLGLRGAPLATRDDAVQRGLDALRDEVDVDAALAVWSAARRVPEWDRPPVWCHGDLLPGNLLARDGQLAAVLDFGSLGVGDPACDLMIAWGLFDGASRAAFRDALGVDDATWARGRGHALHHALVYIPYYRDTNPAGTRAAWHLLDAALDDA